MKKLWLVRLGKNGEYESDALEKSVLSIGFNITTDLSTARDRNAILDVIKTIFPDASPGRQGNYAAQVNKYGGRR
jgi:restriction system protein